MIYNLWHFLHDQWGMHFWTLPAIIVGVIMVVMVIWHNRSQKKRQADFEEQMRKDAVQAPEASEPSEPVQA